MMMIRRPGAAGGGTAAGGVSGSNGGYGEPEKERAPGVGGGGEHNQPRGSLSKTKKRKAPSSLLLWTGRGGRSPPPPWVVCLLFLGLGPLVVRRVWEGRRRFQSAPASSAAAAGNNATIRKTTATTVESVRNEYYARYGGREAATEIYERGVRRYGTVDATAHRILRCAADRRPLVVSFAGYSVTVGRGNRYRQSFPFVLERVLAPLLEDQLGGATSLVVRNAAIGGIPSFPYGFCFEHFLGTDSDVVSWDYSMNEGGGYGASVLESYVRHAQSQLATTRPMIIAIDSNPQRCQLLRSYAELGIVRDALCVGMAKDAVPDLKSRIREGDEPAGGPVPEGFRNWDEFGAPPGCPGRGSWHPKKMEHELIGWNLAMYFASAVERAVQLVRENPDTWRATYGTGGGGGVPSNDAASPLTLPKPLSTTLPANDEAVTRLLYGHKVEGGEDGDRYTMHPVSCRTNFLPALNQDKVLPSIVVSGLASDNRPESLANQDILKERDDAQYRSGWVLDVSKIERDTKVKVDACGGLGYVDMKIALYGIPESGTLRLWLPVAAAATPASTLASDYVQELVICEANEKRPERACRLDRDLSYTVGGAKVDAPTMIKGAAEYLKRSTCVHVGIPPKAAVASLESVVDANNRPISVDVRRRLEGNHPSQSYQLKKGLLVDIQVTGSVNRKDGACCISHVVWEHAAP